MKFKLELKLSDPDHLKVLAILAALLEDGDEVFEKNQLSGWQILFAIKYILIDATSFVLLTEEDLEELIEDMQSEAKEKLRQALKPCLSTSTVNPPHQNQP